MTKPKAYDPQEGYQFQIFCRNQQYGGAWEHCDYAVDRADKDHLTGEYKIAYGPGWEFKHEFLPMKFWPKRASALATAVLICCFWLCFAQAAQTKVTCTTLLTGRVVCTDSDSGKTYERVDKLTGDSEWVVTQPGREHRHPERGGHSYDNDHNRHWDRD